MKSSDTTNTLEAGRATLGRCAITPIDEGFFVSGEIHLTNQGGYANLSIPISGPDGDATIYVEAEKSGNDWSFRALEVVVRDTGQWIHLMD